MAISRKFGDILDFTENIIVQSVNHQGVMGGGLAKQIVTKYPIINNENSVYQIMCRGMYFEDIKMHGFVSWYTIQENKFIASIFGQDGYGRDRQYTDYVALGNGLDSVRLFAKEKQASIAIPFMMGCGLGGGDWSVVFNIIENCFKYSPEISVFIYELL